MEQDNTLQEKQQETTLPAANGIDPDAASADGITQADDELSPETESARQEYPLEFTLTYRISEEDLFAFHKITGAAQMEKNKKRMMIMGVIELIFGVFYLASILVSKIQSTPMQYLLGLFLAGMGLYGIFTNKNGYERQLRAAVKRQHKRTPYFQNDIQVDFYPHKCVEQLGKAGQETYWKDVRRVMQTERSYIIWIENKRCLLLSTSTLAQDTKETLSQYLREVCERYEKPLEEQ